MDKPGNGNTTRSPVRQPVLLGLFAGTAIGSGYLLAGVPNVELMTLVTALAGAVMGARAGFGVGLVAMLVYSLGSPYGIPLPTLLAAQAVGLGLAGVCGHRGAGGIAAALAADRLRWAMFRAGIVGLVATLLFDLLTNLAIIGFLDMSPALVLAGALPFFLVHAGVNYVLFATLVPLLLPRLVGLGRGDLVGRSGSGPLAAAVVALLLAAAPASAQVPAGDAPDTTGVNPEATGVSAESTTATAADSLAGPGRPPAEPLTGAAKAFGWERPLWQPFAPTALDWLSWYSPLVPVRDGGLGASSVILAEAGTSPVPLITRDGIPVGTGHVLADDPSLVPTENLEFTRIATGQDGWGGTDGLIALETDDLDPDKAASGYRGIKGRHETYFRAIHVLTPRASWRAAFEFEESLDNEGYNFTELSDPEFAATGDEFPGHGKVRQSRTRLFRELDEDNRFIVEYSNGRKTKDSLPSQGADHQEIWDDGIAATIQGRLGGWKVDSSLFWRNRDVEWGDRDTTLAVGRRRKVETGREGLTLDMNRPGGPDGRRTTGLRLQLLHWRVYDEGVDPTWEGAFPGGGDGEGASGLVAFRPILDLGPSRWELDLGALWDRHAGWAPQLGLGVDDGGEHPWWRLEFSYGGRAPRSDELLTPLLRVVADRQLTLLPSGDLAREKTARAALLLQARLLGLDLAVDGSVRRLEDGITWEESGTGTDVGIWSNGLAMDSAGVTGRIGRQGRFLGWGRLMVEGAWRKFEEKKGRAAFLPPERYLRFHAMWENHFFEEDGILQLALFSTHQGEMADPWDVTRTYLLPSRTVHDLVVGFRLVGAHLSLALRNLTGERTRLTSGALSTGQELDMRLLWNFSY